MEDVTATAGSGPPGLAPAVDVRGLSYRYADGTAALQDVSFSVAHGERVAVGGAHASATPRTPGQKTGA